MRSLKASFKRSQGRLFTILFRFLTLLRLEHGALNQKGPFWKGSEQLLRCFPLRCAVLLKPRSFRDPKDCGSRSCVSVSLQSLCSLRSFRFHENACAFAAKISGSTVDVPWRVTTNQPCSSRQYLAGGTLHAFAYRLLLNQS